MLGWRKEIEGRGGMFLDWEGGRVVGVSDGRVVVLS